MTEKKLSNQKNLTEDTKRQFDGFVMGRVFVRPVVGNEVNREVVEAVLKHKS